jgi:hypothetical protein
MSIGDVGSVYQNTPHYSPENRDESDIPDIQPFYAGLGEECGPLILHMLPCATHRTVVNAFQGTLN